MVRVIDPQNCGGPGLSCPGSPESRARRKRGRGLVFGGAICSDACHNDPPGPCSREPEFAPNLDQKTDKKPNVGPDTLGSILGELEKIDWDSRPRPLGLDDEWPKMKLGPLPERLKPRIPSPFSPHPLEKIEGQILPNDLVGPDNGMSTEDREGKI